MKTGSLLLLFVGLSSFALAAGATPVPEISPATAVGAITLLSGALLVIRGRRK